MKTLRLLFVLVVLSGLFRSTTVLGASNHSGDVLTAEDHWPSSDYIIPDLLLKNAQVVSGHESENKNTDTNHSVFRKSLLKATGLSGNLCRHYHFQLIINRVIIYQCMLC
jgi:hypothetical protein